MQLGKKSIWGIFLLFAICSISYATPPSNSTMQLTCPYWYGTFDAAGFSDAMYWGNSPYHPHG
ncbi:MAG: hypothetical protein JW720_10205, partial [Sedimentisphaerales bacterium]|nr:hypothetical protein [Sedimentisphaerales bacterium]